MCMYRNFVFSFEALPRCRRTPAGLYIETQILARTHRGFQSVLGKMDTGASSTLFTFDTARRLGIDDPSIGSIDQWDMKSASGHIIPCYVHLVSVQIEDTGGNKFQFFLEVAFSQEIERDLFGIDWCSYFCLGIDNSSVHLLRD